MSILHSAEQVPGGLPVATSRARHHHMLPLEKTGGITASALPGALFGNSLKAKSASARQVSSSTCCPSQRQLTSPGPPRLAAGSAVCCSLLSPLELSYQFPKFYKRNQHRPIKNIKSLGDGECFPPTPSAQRQLPLEFNRSHCLWEPQHAAGTSCYFVFLHRNLQHLDVQLFCHFYQLL